MSKLTLYLKLSFVLIATHSSQPIDKHFTYQDEVLTWVRGETEKLEFPVVITK
jgi:hypothetical protein